MVAAFGVGFALACGGSGGPTSAPFDVRVTLDAAAREAMTSRGERVVVSVLFEEEGGAADDDAGYREAIGDLGPEGGAFTVPATDLSPARPGRPPLTQITVNVYSARLTTEDNLLSCGYAGDRIVDVPASGYDIACSLIE